MKPFSKLVLPVLLVAFAAAPSAAQRVIVEGPPAGGGAMGAAGAGVNNGLTNGAGTPNLGTSLGTTSSAPNLTTNLGTTSGVPSGTQSTGGETTLSDDERADQYLDSYAEQEDLIGSLPIVDKMRRVRN